MLSVCMSRYHVCSAQKPEEDTGFPEDWSYMLLATRWVLGIRPRSSERAADILYYWAISPVSVY